MVISAMGGLYEDHAFFAELQESRANMSKTTNKFSPEVCERAIRCRRPGGSDEISRTEMAALEVNQIAEQPR
ncbi:hypothetical protein ELG83_36090 [Rhizobium leguminosarum]|nr:hypothetical protein ELG92_36040 [Rhizobium leguminosarum]TBF23603.1 hypothetical protein ELG88_35410 [Rhizobium leguminosarum]TBF45420.1 hypothetical protein ELG87_35655 [Rhizobium leguminosarum]TBF47197.1 hypothetical protein ELG91_28865 [Rhizobium leguminosarum]TBF64388.1 hypothetical protein ELG89_35910 [Rhizobium leguminosarum]